MVKLTVWNDVDKPHKGRINHWTVLRDQVGAPNMISGLFVEANSWSTTSEVIKFTEPNKFGYHEVETKDSRYTLVGDELSWEEYVKKRQDVESDKHAQAYRLLSVGPKPIHVQGDTTNKERNKKRNGKPTYYTRETQTRVAPRNSPK